MKWCSRPTFALAALQHAWPLRIMMNRFIAGDRAPGSPEGAEMLTGVDPPLDGAVILLEHVVQIWHRPMPAILGESAFGFELHDGGRIRGVAVGVDHPRRGMVLPSQCF